MKRSRAAGKKAAPAGKPLNLMDLLHTAYAAQAEVEAQLTTAGLSLAKLHALQALADAGGSVPLGQLAERLACVKSNITQLVDRLEADGFVAREADPNDRRTRLAVLTAAGRKACAEGTRLHQESERRLLHGLTHDEARQLGALLEKVGRPRS
jgi:DNA-binding MarR family transcriptional regulator